MVRVQAGELPDEKAQANGLGFSALWGLNGTAGHLWTRYSGQRVSVSGDASAEVQSYVEAFEELRTSAVEPAESRDLLVEIIGAAG